MLFLLRFWSGLANPNESRSSRSQLVSGDHAPPVGPTATLLRLPGLVHTRSRPLLPRSGDESVSPLGGVGNMKNDAFDVLRNALIGSAGDEGGGVRTWLAYSFDVNARCCESTHDERSGEDRARGSNWLILVERRMR